MENPSYAGPDSMQYSSSSTRLIRASSLLAVAALALATLASAQQPTPAGQPRQQQPQQNQPAQSQTQPQSPRIRAPIRDDQRWFQKSVKTWRELSRENIVMQQRDYSCGAAALATLMRYHLKENVTELQLLVEVVRMLTPPAHSPASISQRTGGFRQP